MPSLAISEDVLFYVLAALLVVVLAIAIRLAFRKKPPESRYVEALNALLEGNEDKALEDLRQTVQVEKTNIDAFLRLGNLLRKRGAIDRALRIHRDLDVGTFFRRKLTATEKFRIREAIADDLLAARRSEEALAVLGELLKRDKMSRRIRGKMLAVYESRADWEKAYALYREGLKVRKEKAPERIGRYRAFCGSAIYDGGNPDRGTTIWDDALRSDPLCAEALFRRGQKASEEGDHSNAISYWERFHSASPELAFLTYERFEKALFETGDLNRIESVYQGILDKRPDDERTMIALATFHARRGEREQALEIARRAADRHTGSTSSLRLVLGLLADGNDSQQSNEIVKFLASRPAEETVLECTRCNHVSIRPFWRCPTCLDWNTARPLRRQGARS